MSYATVAQYQARYGTVSDTALLQECLDDCTAAINVALDNAGIDYSSPSTTFADRLMRVCRSMANRLMPIDGDSDIPIGVASISQTAGSYTRQYSFASGYSTPKLLQSELDMLGIAAARTGIGWAQLGGYDDTESSDV